MSINWFDDGAVQISKGFHSTAGSEILLLEPLK